ncbi:uL13 family ribosomal protein [Candidatus Carsonella ruddii]|uniref:Putative ribosomal protein L13 n=1 Tax=Candidatus Carsonella ruddii PC isolate NHV TaxID=1202540 RepID=J3TEN6_CARRU|nr:uL13 family ribosomal protein [Candidatus Carsonella ruddii]AFP84272.1 putative ribosomal protein L13 [Candidatus Carsonella ruddii PC isolate NHV]
MIIINCLNKKLGRILSIVAKIIIYFNFFKKKIKIFLINIKNFNFNKNKLFTHSGYIGNIKTKFKNKNKKKYVKKSIYNMLPKNYNRIILLKQIFFLL